MKKIMVIAVALSLGMGASAQRFGHGLGGGHVYIAPPRVSVGIGYSPFYYDLTSYLRPAGQENVLAVRVENEGRNARWYSGSGIYRHVCLTVAEPVHVAPWGIYITTPDVYSATAIYASANFMERETYDFFGVNFLGHPNLIRILNVDEMDYFPMRKEFPLEDQSRVDKDDEMFGRG